MSLSPQIYPDSTIEENHELISKAITETCVLVEKMEINSDADHAKIRPHYSNAREWKKRIEDFKKDAAAPLKKRIAAINDKAAELLDPLERIISLCNEKTNAYMKSLESKAKAEKEAAREAAEILGLSETVYVPEVSHTLKGDGALAVTKTIKKFRVVDASLVPLKYLLVDEKAVQNDLKLGIQTIPGLEIYEETITTLRTR
jgi:hypothetical protein